MGRLRNRIVSFLYLVESCLYLFGDFFFIQNFMGGHRIRISRRSKFIRGLGKFIRRIYGYYVVGGFRILFGAWPYSFDDFMAVFEV